MIGLPSLIRHAPGFDNSSPGARLAAMREGKPPQRVETTTQRLPVVLIAHASYVRLLAHAAYRHRDRVEVVGIIRADYRSLGPKTMELGARLFSRYPWFFLKVTMFELLLRFLPALRGTLRRDAALRPPTIRLSKREKLTTEAGKAKVRSLLDDIRAANGQRDYVLASWMAPLIPAELLNEFVAAVNLHPARLPGAGGYGCWLPIFMNEQYRHAWTIHVMANQIDTGRILKQYEQPRPENLWQHHARDPRAQAETLMEFLSAFEPGDTSQGVEQPAGSPVYTFAKFLDNFDDWYQSMKQRRALGVRARELWQIVKCNINA